MFLEKNPNPTKDQHFMVDKSMLELIYDTANIQEGESIVEIGGGAGALTDYLVKGNNFVTVIEKDPYYANLLKEKYAACPNVEVIEGDALNYNFAAYDRVVANLPYTITEPFLINLAASGALDYNANDMKGSRVKSVTLVLSQNSVRKMVAPVQITEGKSKHLNQEFGIMGAISKTFCDVDIVTAIPSEAFFPEPAVTSFVVNMTPKKEKTTVDRILKEMLVDKKGSRPSVKRVYQLMMVRGEIYKANKHKNNISSVAISSFTSKNIEDQNIYDLSHSQISQLVQDLIRNDVSIKSKNSGRKLRRIEDEYSSYFSGNRFVYNPDDYAGDTDMEEDSRESTSNSRKKYEEKYQYMYESAQYDALLQRGLEYLEPGELQRLLGRTVEIEGNRLSKRGM